LLEKMLPQLVKPSEVKRISPAPGADGLVRTPELVLLDWPAAHAISNTAPVAPGGSFLFGGFTLQPKTAPATPAQAPPVHAPAVVNKKNIKKSKAKTETAPPAAQNVAQPAAPPVTMTRDSLPRTFTPSDSLPRAAMPESLRRMAQDSLPRQPMVSDSARFSMPVSATSRRDSIPPRPAWMLSDSGRASVPMERIAQPEQSDTDRAVRRIRISPP
jgi:hypothetical protein